MKMEPPVSDFDLRRVAVAFQLAEQWKSVPSKLAPQLNPHDSWIIGDTPYVLWDPVEGWFQMEDENENMLLVGSGFASFGNLNESLVEDRSIIGRVARGLYKLGQERTLLVLEAEFGLQLSAHDKLACHAALPQEFWPSHWQ